MKDKKQLFVSIGLNGLIIIFSLIGLILKLIENKVQYCLTFAFYTYVLTVIVFSIYLYYEIRSIKTNKDINKKLEYYKYVLTIMQTLVMIYWAIFIAPLAGNEFLGIYLFKGGSLFLHLLSPVASIITLLGYDGVTLNKKQTLTSLIPTIIYGALIIFLNLVHVLIGPYGFFEVYYSPYQVIFITPFALLFVELIIGYLLYLCNSASLKAKKQIK